MMLVTLADGLFNHKRSCEFAPALRTITQLETFRIALQVFGDLTGFDISYFDFGEPHGYVCTVTGVSFDSHIIQDVPVGKARDMAKVASPCTPESIR